MMLASLSYRVAMRRHCLSLAKKSLQREAESERKPFDKLKGERGGWQSNRHAELVSASMNTRPALDRHGATRLAMTGPILSLRGALATKQSSYAPLWIATSRFAVLAMTGGTFAGFSQKSCGDKI
jgi:hypothetical protein